MMTIKPSFRLPDRFDWLIIFIVILSLIKLISASLAPLMPDEAYYWLWSKHLSFGYYDHPPFVAYMIKMGGFFLGESVIGVRLFGLLAHFGTLFFIYDSAKRLWGEPPARRALLWSSLCVLLSLTGQVATPDPFSLLFWTGALYGLVRLTLSSEGKWWYYIAFMASFGVLAKYTNLFFGLGLICWLILADEARKWWKSPHLYGAGLLFALLIMPHFWWLFTHEWQSVLKQFGRLNPDEKPQFYVGQTLFAQAFLINMAIVFLGFKNGLMKKTDHVQKPTNGLALLVLTSLPIIAYLLFYATKTQVQGNWPLLVHGAIVLFCIALWVRTQKPAKKMTDILILACGLLPILFSLGVSFVTATDRPALALWIAQNWPNTLENLKHNQIKQGLPQIFVTDYDLMGPLSYVARKDPTVRLVPVFERDRYLWIKQAPEGRGLMVQKASQPIAHRHCYRVLIKSETFKRISTEKKSTLDLYIAELYPNCLPFRSL